MKYLLTGYNGFIGSNVLHSLKSDFNIEGLNYYRFAQKSYPDLSYFQTRPVTIIHIGASSSRDQIGKHLYRDNLHSIYELVNFCSQSSDRKLIFISANSIGFSKHTSYFGDLYSYLKYKSEQLIINKLPREQYCIARLPAVYQRGRLGSGFIDKIYASDDYPQPIIINENNLFNNMISVGSLTNFLATLLKLNHLPGYLGSLATCNPLTLAEICSLLQEFKKIPLQLIYKSDPTQKRIYSISAAVEYGYIPEDTSQLISFLYSA